MYRFVHDFPTIFHGLVHGVNAIVHPGDGRQVPESTVTLHPGDQVELLDPDDPHHGHAFLEPIKPAKPRRKTTTAPTDTPED